MGIPEGEKKERGTQSLLKEIIGKNFPSLWKELNIRTEKANRTPKCTNAKRPSPKCILFKLSNINDKVTILKATRGEKDCNLQRKAHKIITNFSVGTLQAKRMEGNSQII